MKLSDLKNVYPAIPRECHEVLVKTAAGLTDKAVRSRRTLVLIALFCLLPLLAGAALAAHIGILNFRREPLYDSLPAEAQKLVAADLAEKTLSGVSLHVKEAFYDGRVLEILFSAAPINPQRESAPVTDEQIASEAYALFLRAGLKPQFYNGTVNVNAQQVKLSAYDYRAGDAPGEYEYLTYSALEYKDERMDNTVPISFKTLRPQGSLDISIDVNDLKGNKIDALSFALPVPDGRRWTKPLPPPYHVNGCTVTFTDLYFSPVNTFLEYSVLVPAAIAREESLDEMPGWLFDLEDHFPIGLTNEAGLHLDGTGGQGITHCSWLENGDLAVDYYAQYPVNNEYTDTVYLSVCEETLPISIK